MSTETTQGTIAPVHTFGNSTFGGQRFALRLTILFHPDTSRIGAFVVLGERDSGGAYGEAFRLARQTPILSDGLGLGLNWISRSGILDMCTSADAIWFESVKENLSLRIEGWPIEVSKPEPIARLQAGIVIHLTAGCVVMLREAPLMPSMNMPAVASELYPGCSPEAERLRQLLHFAAEHEKPTLIVGDSGVGKERAANAIHRTRIKTAVKPLILDAASVQASESTETLFGHFEPEFMAAAAEEHNQPRRRLGVFRQAFLDKTTLLIKHIDRALQPVQRQLQMGLDGRVAPVGDTPQDGIHVPVVATSMTGFDDLKVFAPLKARLQQVIAIPPLHRRREDIALALALQFEQDGSPRTAEYDFDTVGSDDAAARWWAKTFFKVLTAGSVSQCPGNYWDVQRYASGLSNEDEEPVVGEVVNAPHTHSGQASEPKSLADMSDEELEKLAARFEYNYRALAAQIKVSPSAFYRRLEDHSRLRTSKEISLTEISKALADTDGNYAKAALSLRVSMKALRSRETQLKKNE